MNTLRRAIGFQSPTSVAILVFLCVLGCNEGMPEQDYVARIGDRTLTRDELNRSLADRPAILDSTEAASQIVERWLANELLYQEALDRGLQTEENIQRLLAENERSVLISALVTRIYEEETEVPDETALQAYYESHRDQLILREPYVRVRLIQAGDSLAAAAAADSLRELPPDLSGRAPFVRLADQLSLDPEESKSLAESYYPTTRLFAHIPGMSEAMTEARPGEVLPILRSQGRFFVLQLSDRIPVGELPRLDMIRDELEERVRIEARKQLFARHVQRLRTRAIARDRLEIVSPADSSGSSQ